MSKCAPASGRGAMFAAHLSRARHRRPSYISSLAIPASECAPYLFRGIPRSAKQQFFPFSFDAVAIRREPRSNAVFSDAIRADPKCGKRNSCALADPRARELNRGSKEAAMVAASGANSSLREFSVRYVRRMIYIYIYIFILYKYRCIRLTTNTLVALYSGGLITQIIDADADY